MPPRSGASSTAATLVLSSDRRSTFSLPRPSETAVTTRDLCFTPATELQRLYRRGQTSPLEVMEAVLARVDAVNPKLNAIVTLTRESALREARAATAALRRKSKTLGPLHGVPVTIKDLTHTKGVRTTWGSKVFEDHVPTEDALIVERLKAAGAIVLGKTNTPEFGAGGNTFNAVFGITRNPWNPALTCGGSSGGAAVALATGMGPIAQGSDTGGSLRTPAAFCGVVGFRTSPGLIPSYPKLIGWESISVTGPMARTVADVALMLSVVARHAEKLARWRDQMQKGLVWNIEQGLKLSPEEIGRAEALRTILWHRVRTFMATRHLLILPTVAVPPFPVETPYPTEINGKPLDNYTQWFFLTYGITLTGLPAISVPCGFTASGLPVGLQIVGRRHQETMVLRAAAAFEAAAPWAHRIPPTVTGS